ncbi:MAG TPA: ABC transporter permease [Flavihumibacter sp.]|nr:ABC transporter permease [Flavihumibacter sp.]
MMNLLKTEWLKLKRYPAFWLLVGICLVSYPGINYIFLQGFLELVERQSGAGQVLALFIGEPFSFPEVWRTSAFFSSVFVFLPSVLVIMLITNEFTYKTHRQNIIDGWSRQQFMLAKMIDVIIITMILTLIYALTAFVMGYTQTTDPAASKTALLYYVLLFGLQTFSQLSIAFLIGLLVRKSFIALAVFLFYSFIVENLLVGLLKYKLGETDLGRFLPLEISDRIIPPPAFMNRINEEGYKHALALVHPHIVYTVILVIITWLLSFYLFYKRDL